MTPEKEIKDLTKNWLKEIGAWFIMVVPGGFSRSGIPDFLCLAEGIFFAIEAKARGKEKNVSALQRRELAAIEKSGGGAFVVHDEGSLNIVKQWLEEQLMKKARTTYNIEAAEARVDVGWAGQKTSFVIDGSLNPVARYLALKGLVAYLQEKTIKADESEKMAALQDAFDRLKEQGMVAFERKAPTFAKQTGPKKADKVAALAMLLNTTPGVIKEKLDAKEPEEQERILNQPQVLEKAQEMLDAGENVDL